MFRGAVGIRTCGRSPCTLWEAPNTPEGRKQVFVNLEAAFVEFFFAQNLLRKGSFKWIVVLNSGPPPPAPSCPRHRLMRRACVPC